MTDAPSDEAWPSIDRWAELHRMWWEHVLRVHQILASHPAPALEEAHRRSVDAWTDAQRRAWRSWLAMTHGYEASASRDAEDAGAAMAAALRAAAERLVESQADWARAWNDQNPGDQADDKA